MRANARAARAAAALLALVVGAGAPACGPKVDLKNALQLNVSSTGWFDAGVTDGKNKLVPTVSFTLKNQSDQTLSTLQVNAIFRRVTEKDEWGSGMITAAGSKGLAPNGETPTLTVKSQLGYTGTESRQDMLQNRQFVDAKVELFAKYGSTQWTRLGEYPIARRLIVP